MPDDERNDVADRISKRFEGDDDTDREDQTVSDDRDDDPSDDAVDEPDSPNAPSVPYGTSRTYRTPDGFELADIDKNSVRDGADREIYMPEELLDELDLAFDQLNLRYKTEMGRSLNKHPHWYNRLLVIGLSVVGDVQERDLDELQELLDLPEASE